VTVYDVLGRRLTELFVGEVEARKEYTFEVDVRDWASGLHMYQVAGNGFQKSGSFTVIK
jgi:hypothetical protein